MAAALLLLAATAVTEPRLLAFGPWLDRCWSANVAPAAVDTHCFSAVLNGRHVRDVHRVTAGGQTVYEGETLYSVEGGVMTFTYYTSLGGIGRGSVVTIPYGLRFRGMMRASPAGQAKPFTVTWRRLSGDRYEVTADGKPRVYQQAVPAP